MAPVCDVDTASAVVGNHTVSLLWCIEKPSGFFMPLENEQRFLTFSFSVE